MSESIEQLTKKRDEMKAAIAAKAVQSEIAALEVELKGETKVEVQAPDYARTTGEMKKSAEGKDFEKFQVQFADLKAQIAKVADTKSTERQGKEVYIPSYVQKEFGAKGAEVVSFAKDVARRLPIFDGVAQVLGKKVSELKMFQKEFPGKSQADLELAIKALVSTTANAGDEFVPTIFSDVVADRLVDQNVVMANLPILDMPSNPYRIPIYTALPTTYYVTEGSTVTAADPTTDAKDLDARKVMNKVVYSGEMEEDSIVPILPFVQRVMAESLGNAIERVVLFGDTVTTASTNINLIDGTPTTTAGAASLYLTRDGLIKETFGSNGKTLDISSDIVAKFASLAQKLGVGGLNMGDLLAFMNVELSYTYMANSAFQSVQQIGNAATLLVGQLGRIFGVPVLPSSGIPKTNSAGKIPAAGGTLGSVLLVKKNGVLIGFKRRPSFKDNDILQAADQRAWVASARLDVKVLQPNATDRAAVAYGYNATL